MKKNSNDLIYVCDSFSCYRDEIRIVSIFTKHIDTRTLFEKLMFLDKDLWLKKIYFVKIYLTNNNFHEIGYDDSEVLAQRKYNEICKNLGLI